MASTARAQPKLAQQERERTRPRLGWLRGGWTMGLAGGVLAIFLLVALLAPLLTPYDPLAMAPDNAFAPPSAQYWFGADEFGRDIFSRVLIGTRISVGTAVVVVLLATLVGVPIGLIAGYFGGLVDQIAMRLVDTILAFPAILLAMGLIAVLGQSVLNSMLAVVIVSIPAFARLTRASVLQQRELEYVKASQVAGATDGRIMLKTILPNTLSPLLVQLAISATWAVLLEAGLSFLGLGVKPPTPSWGQMLDTSRDYLYRAPWYGLYPGLFLTLLVLSLNSLADALQKLFSRGKIR